MESSASIVQFRQVSYRYPTGNYALKNISFHIYRNRKTAIVGANGAGKSTLVLHMNGIYLPNEGQVCFNGKPIDKKNRDRMNTHVGIVFQDPDDQIISMSVWDDVAFGPAQQGLNAEEIKLRTEKYLSLLKIDHLADKNPNQLSFGQKKVVAIAGVLAMETELVVFDEPMAFLDPVGKKEIQRILDLLISQGKTVVITTHDMQLVAEWAEDVIVMKEGTCLETTTPKQLFANRQLLETANLNLPPVAELISPFWNGNCNDMPIRLNEAKEWLKQILSKQN